MGTRSVRLDPERERKLEEVVSRTGMTASGVLKQGVDEIYSKVAKRPTFWEIYSKLDLGPGGDATAPSTEVRRGVREALRRKLGR